MVSTHCSTWDLKNIWIAAGSHGSNIKGAHVEDLSVRRPNVPEFIQKSSCSNPSHVGKAEVKEGLFIAHYHSDRQPSNAFPSLWIYKLSPRQSKAKEGGNNTNRSRVPATKTSSTSLKCKSWDQVQSSRNRMQRSWEEAHQNEQVFPTNTSSQASG